MLTQDIRFDQSVEGGTDSNLSHGSRVSVVQVSPAIQAKELITEGIGLILSGKWHFGAITFPVTSHFAFTRES
jgi:hypothetical protein